MKIYVSRSTVRRGFTLVELLVVISVIVALAAIVWVSLSGAQKGAYRQRAQTQLAALETGLQSYKNDFGVFPETENASDGSGAAVLYQAMTGNGNDALPGGSVAPKEDPKDTDLLYEPYMPEMLPGNQGSIQWVEYSFGFFVLDPWGEEWNYEAGTNDTFNLDYDLWSYGGGTGTEGEEDKDWIKNW